MIVERSNKILSDFQRYYSALMAFFGQYYYLDVFGSYHVYVMYFLWIKFYISTLGIEPKTYKKKF